MTREQTITALKKYFDIRELVSPAVFNKFGQSAWKVFDTRLLETLLVLRRDILQVPLVCNNWKSGGKLTQRGYRENVSDIVRQKTDNGSLYVSAHTLGQAVDLSSGKLSADEMRSKVQAMKTKLPHPIRIENGKDAPTWLHADVMTDSNNLITVF